MADQHNSNIPDLSNLILDDVPDIKESIEYHKDVFENFCGTWSNTVATGIFPNKIEDTSATPVVLQPLCLDIGNWNMDSTDSVSVAHGLTLTKIRHASAMIRGDGDNNYFPIAATPVASLGAYIELIDSTEIIISRTANSFFDSTAFDSTSYNRGWIMIWYAV
jgi:hypothetical protein